MKSWLDGFVEDVSKWVARNTSPQGVLATTSRVAGVSTVSPLPLDRRDEIEVDKTHDHQHRLKTPIEDPVGRLAAMAGHPQKGTPTCSDPQYCNMHGHPCACCDGSDTTCPSGTEIGHYWSFCCSGRSIYFTDCCGRGKKCNTTSCPFCENSSQPNWCGGMGGNVYVCTMAEDKGSC